MTKLTRSEWQELRTAGWKDTVGRWVSGVTAYLLLSGLAIYALPFSLFNQHSVILHTLVGVLFLVPCVVYLMQHIRAYRSYPSTHVKFSGYAAGAMTVVCCVSGVALTFESALGTRITYLWQTTHILTTFGVLVFLCAHLGTLWARARKGTETTAEGALRAALRGHAALQQRPKLAPARTPVIVATGKTGSGKAKRCYKNNKTKRIFHNSPPVKLNTTAYICYHIRSFDRLH